MNTNPEWKLSPATATPEMVKAGLMWLVHFQHMRIADKRAALASAFEAMLASAPEAPPLTVTVDPDARGVSVGVYQGTRCVYSGTHPIPASTVATEGEKDERQAFEAWSKRANQGYDLTRNVSGKMATYESNLTEHAYRGFFHGINAKAPAAGDALTAAARDVLAERQRQISAEGRKIDKDDRYSQQELASAAAQYALNAAGWRGLDVWPWDRAWFKPTKPRRDLVKAGALILAEIERLDRAAIAQQSQRKEA